MRNLIRGVTAALLLAVLPLAANAGVFVSVTIAPPLLPVYEPPPLPGPGYVWTPGYWAWADDGYYWVPGTWVLAPSPGLLWTPGYWGFADGIYLWHVGYWGPHVGFYGGINYGFGYSGVGFHGGYWRGNTYIVNRVVINEAPVNRVCFNGGGGIVAHASPTELRFAHERHVGMSEPQRHNEALAARDNTMRASVNHGRPSVAATPRPGVFYGHGVVAARAGGERPALAQHGTLGEHGASGARPPVAVNSPGAPRAGGERPALAQHGTLGEHGAGGARPPVAMNSPGAPPRAGGERPALAQHGTLGEHGAGGARPPVAMNPPGAPRAMNQPFRPEPAAPRGAPGGAVHAPQPGMAHRPFPGGGAPQANPGVARQAYPGNAHAANGGAPPRGTQGGPRGEPGNAHAAQQGRGGERPDRSADHGRR